MFTRLLLSLIITGIAPLSFYRKDISNPHYDGLPVGFTAEAIAKKQKQHSVLPLLHAFAKPDENNGLDIPTERFRAAVRKAGVGPDKDIPHITKELIGKYATDLAQLGLI
ncbi:hypothetical protein [Kibdelosporangium aridum]|nr:hypothetical protein [Kibdelosporangium aridum]